jgi:hypothetical protein
MRRLSAMRYPGVSCSSSGAPCPGRRCRHLRHGGRRGCLRQRRAARAARFVLHGAGGRRRTRTLGGPELAGRPTRALSVRRGGPATPSAGPVRRFHRPPGIPNRHVPGAAAARPAPPTRARRVCWRQRRHSAVSGAPRAQFGCRHGLVVGHSGERLDPRVRRGDSGPTAPRCPGRSVRTGLSRTNLCGAACSGPPCPRSYATPSSGMRATHVVPGNRSFGSTCVPGGTTVPGGISAPCQRCSGHRVWTVPSSLRSTTRCCPTDQAAPSAGAVCQQFSRPDGDSATAWRWWYAAQPENQTPEEERWSFVRAWVAERLRTFVATRPRTCHPALPLPSAQRMLDCSTFDIRDFNGGFVVAKI